MILLLFPLLNALSGFSCSSDLFLFMNEVVAFLPCRAGSERVPHKNTKPFSASGLSLIQIKLSQLVNSDLIGKIIVSSNDNTVLDISSNFHPKVTVNKRPDSLCCSNTSTDDLIKYVPTIIQDATVLWTHVTSPFISSAIYDSAIDKFLNNSSFPIPWMSVTPCHDLLWDSQGPINYDRSLEKWPRTQTLNKLFRVNTVVFLFHHPPHIITLLIVLVSNHFYMNLTL